jgi:hypothetical protein
VRARGPIRTLRVSLSGFQVIILCSNRFHAAKGAHRITATSDMTNLPMAAAFERAGYRNYEVRLILSAPADRSG